AGDSAGVTRTEASVVRIRSGNYSERTIIVEAGRMRTIADLAGLNTIRFDGSATAVKKIIERLAPSFRSWPVA
ncbi:MAG: hypothetical protein ACXWMU_06820, partial [Candidatus Limnocylindrales bacterium]